MEPGGVGEGGYICHFAVRPSHVRPEQGDVQASDAPPSLVGHSTLLIDRIVTLSASPCAPGIPGVFDSGQFSGCLIRGHCSSSRAMPQTLTLCCELLQAFSEVLMNSLLPVGHVCCVRGRSLPTSLHLTQAAAGVGILISVLLDVIVGSGLMQDIQGMLLSGTANSLKATLGEIPPGDQVLKSLHKKVSTASSASHTASVPMLPCSGASH